MNVSDETIEKVLTTRRPGGSEVWHVVNGGGMRIADDHRNTARVVIEAFLALQPVVPTP